MSDQLMSLTFGAIGYEVLIHSAKITEGKGDLVAA